MAKFFVSYSRSVKDEVRKVVELLIASGHEVWWDDDIPAIADWWATILDRIEWCEVFIFVASPQSVQSIYCLTELKYASDRQRPVLPFMLEDPLAMSLPLELPPRGQWLLYDGNPARMLKQINDANHNINRLLHNDIRVPRPAEPLTGGKSLAKQFQEARRLANEKRFEEAKAQFANIKLLDFVEWGIECDEWLARLNSYASVMDLLDESTASRARASWSLHVRQYGREFDPHEIDAQLGDLSAVKPRPSYRVVWIAGSAVVLVIAAVVFFILNNGNGKNTPVLSSLQQLQTNEAEQIAATTTQVDFDLTATEQAVISNNTLAVVQQFTETAATIPITQTAATRIVETSTLANTLSPTDTPSPQEPTRFSTQTSLPLSDRVAGKLVFNDMSVGSANIYTINTDGTGLQQLTNDANYADYGPVWSPDGRQIAFFSNRSNGWELHVMDAAGNNIQQITDRTVNGFTSSAPAWSPDGGQIVFTGVIDWSAPNYNEEIFIIEANGDNPRRLTNRINGDFGAAWSPSGNLIAFTGTLVLPDQRLYLINADGSSERKLTSIFGVNPSWSPDGNFIAFSGSAFNEKHGVYLVDASSGAMTLILEGAASPSWSSDGCSIAYAYNNYIYVLDILSSSSRQVTQGVSPHWRPDNSLPNPDCMTQISNLVSVEYACSVSSPSAVNLRSGPGVNYSVEGQLEGGTPASVSGHTTIDGFQWWRLANYAWVRSDLVNAQGNCIDVPVIE